MSKTFLILTVSIILSVNNEKLKPNTKNISNPKNTTRNRTNYTSYFINSTIPTLDDKNFDKTIQNHNNDYLILFTVKRCQQCNNIIKITEEIQKKYLNQTLKFYKVDCFVSGWTALRFDLSKVPMFIYITNEIFAGYKDENYTKQKIIDFIENKHKEYQVLPGKLGYLGLGVKLFHIISGAIKTKISFWNEGFSLIAVILAVVLFFYFEYNLYKNCCKNNMENERRIKEREKNKKKCNDKECKHHHHE